MIAALQHVRRNLGRRRLRTRLGVLGIFLTLTLLTATRVGLDSISGSYTDLVALQAGKADLLVTRTGGSPFEPIAFDPQPVQERLTTNTLLLGLTPRWVGIVRVETPNDSTDALVIGLNPARERELDTSGLSPEPRLEPGACAVSRALATRLKLDVGSELSARSPATGVGSPWRIDSVFERQLLLPQEVRDFLIVNESEARTILGDPTGVHVLAGRFRDAAAYYDARDLHASVVALKRAGQILAADLGPDFEVRLPKAAAITAFEQFSGPLRAIFGVFALLALAVTGLLVYSIISVAVEERIREYAILRSLGAKRRQVLGLVLLESLVLCLVGTVPGVLAGGLLAQGTVNLAEAIWGAAGNAIPLRITGTTLALTLGAGLLLGLVSAMIPAWQAVQWRIVDALDPLRRGQIPAPPARETMANRALLTTGLALSSLALVVFFVLPTAVLSGDPSLIGTVVLCLLLGILLGFTLLAVAGLPWATHAVLAAIGWAFGPAADLAQRNLVRHRRRNTTTAIMFILAVSLVIFVASLVVLFSSTSMTLVEHLNGADLRLQSGGPHTPRLRETLLQLPGARQVAEIRWLRSRSDYGLANDIVLSDLVGMKHLWVVPFGIGPQLPDVLFTDRVRYAEGGPEALQTVADYTAPANPAPDTGDFPPLILSQSAARFLDAHAGERVQLSFHLGAARVHRRFQIAAICSAVPGFDNIHARVARAVGAGVLLPLNLFDELTQAAPSEVVQGRYLIRADPDPAIQLALAQQLRDDFDLRYRFGVQSVVERQREARILYWVTQIFFGLLLVAAVVIAVFALIASMATAVLERRWEIGVLKALGLRRQHLFRMFLAETLALTLAAGLAGGLIGFTLAYLFVLEAALLMELPLVFTMPYLTFAATWIISLAAGAIAAYLPTRHLLRRPAAEILRLQT